MPPRKEILFSFIVPVYNRPDEVRELLESLASQTDSGFETILVEDGSTIPCREQAAPYAHACSLRYFMRPNEGRSPARNFGMEQASGDFFLFVDSDCVLPRDYVATLRRELTLQGAQFFGGPDAAAPGFSPMQKAVSFAMTSFLTTGGIRGGKRRVEAFVPRTFNMGFSREIWQKTGGFREMFSEDIDMSTRIAAQGHRAELIREAFVYHKRRGDLRSFWRQVHVFGMSRITLQLLYPGSLKAVHAAPALMTLSLPLLLAGSLLQPWLLALPGAYVGAVAADALRQTRSLKTASLAVAASAVQVLGYGTGFLKAWFWKILMRRGRNLDEEVRMRRGK